MPILYFMTSVKSLLFVITTNVNTHISSIFIITSLISILTLYIINSTKIKYKKGIIITLYSIISLIMFIDTVYYRYFNTLTSISMLTQSKQLLHIADTIKKLLNFRVLVFIIDIPIVSYFVWRDKAREKVNMKKTVVITVLLITILLSQVTSFNKKGEILAVSNQEFYNYHIEDIKRYLASKNEGAEAESTNTILSDLVINDLKERRRLKEGNLTGIGKDKNLIVIQFESLQNFVINLDYNGTEITPNLNKLIKDQSSIYYDKYYQLLGRGNTSDAEFVTHNSLYPSMEQPTYEQFEENTFYGLPLMLKDNGYTPWVMHGYKRDFWNRDKAYINQGYERYISEEDYSFSESIGFGITDKDFFTQSLEYIKELDSLDNNPFYAFLITLTSHVPFKIPEKYLTIELEDAHKDTILGDYLQSIHYSDKQLGEFIDGLKREGIYEDTVIAIYGDHFSIPNNEDNKELMSSFLNKEYNFADMMNVPLIITIPGENINKTVSKVGSQLDFYPTIQNIMGYDNTKGIVFGRDLNNYDGYTFVASQTYMIKGSVIDGFMQLEMSRDGIYKNSQAIRLDNGQALEPLDYRDKHNLAISEINLSDYILKNDLVRFILEDK